MMTKSILETIAGNLERLIKHHEIKSQTELAKKTGVSQRTISNVLRPGSLDSINTETIEALARYFNIEPYHLMIPDLPIEELINKRIEKLIECYSQSSPAGRENLERIAENEVRYNRHEETLRFRAGK